MGGPLSSAPAASLLRVGRYEILLDLADEGFVSLLAARVRGPNAGPRIVQLARVRHGLAREVEVQAAFLAEARAASRVRHPNFVYPTDTLVHDGDLYVATEFTLGVRLDELLTAAASQRFEIPVPVALRILLDVLAGLSALHASVANGAGARAFVHGDVAPTNILVSYLGDARIVHSGLSLVTSRVSGLGQRNPRLAYKAPEQLRSGVNAVPIGPAADVFAAGVILWEMLQGARLFDAVSDVEVVDRVLHGKVPELEPGGQRKVPTSLLPLVGMALERDPELRMRSAAQLGEAIERAAEVRLATAAEVALVVDKLVGPLIDDRRAQIEEIVALADESEPPESPLRSNITPHLRSLHPLTAPSSFSRHPSSSRFRVAPSVPSPRFSSPLPAEPESPAAFRAADPWSSRPPVSLRPDRRVESFLASNPEREARAAPRVGWVYYSALGAVLGTLVYAIAAGPVRRPVRDALPVAVTLTTPQKVDPMPSLLSPVRAPHSSSIPPAPSALPAPSPAALPASSAAPRVWVPRPAALPGAKKRNQPVKPSPSDIPAGI